MVQFKCFFNTLKRVQDEVNLWIKKNPKYKVVDFKISDGRSHGFYTFTLMYVLN
jgi:hypothetical protein